METAAISGKCVNGFFHISPLMAVPGLDVIQGVVVDPMHCVFLGVVKQLGELWLNSSHHATRHYIGRRHAAIDANLKMIHPPVSVARKTRSITERHLWKANEWRNWCFFYAVPCLFNILPTIFMDHFNLLSEAIFILSKVNIEVHDINVAEQNLRKFVEQFQNLYGKIHMTYNVHLLLHISDSVRNVGPLWAYSNFAFESNNGVLKSYVHGKTDVNHQIVSKYLLSQHLDLTSNETVNNYLKKTGNKRIHGENFQNKVLGKPQIHLVTDAEKTIFGSVYSILINHRAIVHNTLFKGKKYSTTMKSQSNDYTIQLKNGTITEIDYFLEKENEI